MSYILIILAVLALLNTYPLLISQSLVFQTKETAMKSSVKMVESALSGLPELTEENVGQALASVEETGVSRLLVTDTAGRVLFDSREGGNARGMYAAYTEIVQALLGNDVFSSSYRDGAFRSRAASPVQRCLLLPVRQSCLSEPGRIPGGIPQPHHRRGIRL